MSSTCIIFYESVRETIKTLFKSIADGKKRAHASTSMKSVFVETHALLFAERATKEFVICIQELLEGLLDNYIGRVTARLREQSVFVTLSNIAALLEYEDKNTSRSLLRLIFEEIRDKKEAANTNQDTNNIDVSSMIRKDILKERETSLRTRAFASNLVFGSLAIGLRRIGDKNVHSMIHVYLVFLFSIIDNEKAVKLFEKDIPWEDMASFLNTLKNHGTTLSKVLGEDFSRSEKDVDRSLPEYFLMRGQL